jgi:hypothetical protein
MTEALVGPGEDHLGGDREAGQPYRVHLDPGDGRAAGVRAADGLRDRDRRLGQPGGSEPLGEFAGGAAGRVAFAVGGVVDDLAPRQVAADEDRRGDRQGRR